MSFRIVVYPPSDRAGEAEVGAAIETAVGTSKHAVAELLAGGRHFALNDLDAAVGDELGSRLEGLGWACDVEPMELAEDRVAFLEHEMPKWVRRGLVHRDSVPRIFANYGLEAPSGVVAPAAPRRPPAAPSMAFGTGMLLRGVLALGAVLVGLGLILFIAANWQRIPSAIKIGGSLLLTLVALHIGTRLRAGAHQKVGSMFLLLSVFGIGGVVILIGQIYHLQSDSYTLPLIWGGLVVPLALLLRFSPALYVASGLWLWSYWLYQASHGELPWFYPALLLGFLMPYSLVVENRRLYGTHLWVLMVALISTVLTESFWHCSIFVAALVVLRVRFRRPLYDWMLVAGFLFWHLAFVARWEDFPNVLYALPLAYFFYRASSEKSDLLMIATILNVEVWLITTTLQATERFDLEEPSGLGFSMSLLASGLLWFGIGRRLLGSRDWSVLRAFLLWGGALVCGAVVYAFSFRFYEDESSFYDSPLVLGVALAAGLVGVLLAAQSLLGSSEERARLSAMALVLAMVAVSFGLSFVASPSLAVHVVLFNLTLFVAAFAMLLEGNRSSSLLWYNAGIALFVLLIVSRYFDTFVDFLPRSVFFVLGGLFLIVWAVLVDRQRKRRLALGGDDA
jgi:uncharacterized membrane protein